MLKPSSLLVLLLWAATLSVGAAAQKAMDFDGSPAVPALRSLVNHCLVDHTATSLQNTLLEEGWSRAGGVPTMPSTLLDEETRERIQESNAVHDRLRAFFRDDQPHIITFTTPKKYPDEIATCVIDGEDLDPATLAKLMISALGVPELEGPADPRWRSPLSTDSEVRIAPSGIVGNEDGVSVIVIKTTSARENEDNPKEQ